MRCITVRLQYLLYLQIYSFFLSESMFFVSVSIIHVGPSKMQNNSKERIGSEREVGRLQRTVLFTIISIGSVLPEPSPLFPYLNAALKHFVATRYRKHGARVFVTDVVVFSCCPALGNELKHSQCLKTPLLSCQRKTREHVSSHHQHHVR